MSKKRDAGSVCVLVLAPSFSVKSTRVPVFLASARDFEERLSRLLMALTTIVAVDMGRASAKHAPQAPRVGAHDVILTGLDEEGDSTNEEMPPLEPLEGAAQLGEVWLCGWP